jgi:lysozyme family protein
MPAVKLTTALSDEYQRLFDTCQVRLEKTDTVESILSRLEQNRDRYEYVVSPLGIPWYFLGAIHNMESSLRFTRHLHNGDPLSDRTVNFPAGRPEEGDPPFSWEQSASDALLLKRLDSSKDWSLPALLYNIEGYNGWGYRLYHPHVLSPYLWSGSNHYRSGKYVADGRWSDNAVSTQIGAAVLLRRTAEKQMVDLALAVPVGEAKLPPVRYSPKKEFTHARELQRFLNRIPGIYVREDGLAGRKTSDAFKEVTGYYLNGDPRTKG